MNKTIKISILAVLAILATSFFATPFFAKQELEKSDAGSNVQFKEGVHYFKTAQTLKVNTGKDIEVRELFWYGCPHCYDLEPALNNWLKNKPSNAKFIGTPAVFSKKWIFHAQAFYAIQALGIKDKAHMLIFDTIHKNKQAVNTPKQLASLLNKHYGIEKEKTINALRSFSVDGNVRAANTISVKSGADGVPTIIVDGKYRTSPYIAGGNSNVFNVVNFLIKKAQSER